MFVYKEFAVWQVSIILRDVSFIICDVRRRTKVVTVIEEGFFTCCVIRNIAITSLWVIRVTRVIPAYRWTRVRIRCGVRLRSLNPTLWHIVVTELCEDGIITNTRVLWITIRTFHCRDTRSYTHLLIICLLLSLNLIHTFSIILLTSRYV